MKGFEDWTIEDVKRHNEKINKTSNKNHFPDVGKMVQVDKKKSKYSAKKCEVDGIKFDSEKEAEDLIDYAYYDGDEDDE